MNFGKINRREAAGQCVCTTVSSEIREFTWHYGIVHTIPSGAIQNMNTPKIREVLTQSLHFIKPPDTEPGGTKLIAIFFLNMSEVLMRVFDPPLYSISDFFNKCNKNPSRFLLFGGRRGLSIV